MPAVGTLVEVFTAPRCGYCDKSKALLRKRGVGFLERDISDPAAQADFAARLPRVRSVPQVFIAGRHIGGYEDLRLLSEDGRLEEMIEAPFKPPPVR